MRILLINNAYQQFGSTDEVVCQEEQMLEQHGEIVLMYGRSNLEIANGPLKERILLPINSIYSVRTRTEVGRIVSEHRPDVAYVHNFLPLISPSVYHTLHAWRIPSVQVLHEFRLLCPNSVFYTRGGPCERCKNGNYLHAVRYRCYRNSYFASFVCSAALAINRFAGMLDKISAFLCLTEFSRQKLLQVGVPAEKLFVRPHFIDCTQIRPRFGGGGYILYLGRLSEEKGLWTLLRAASRLKDVEFKIAGRGPLENSLRRLATEQGLTNVEFVGAKTVREKWDLLCDCLCVVVPSECYETFGMVVLEAYAAGKPVIGSDLGSLPFVIEDGNSGLLFRCGNAEELADKARYLISDSTARQRMGKHGRRLVETRYSPAEGYKALMQVFNRVAGG